MTEEKAEEGKILIATYNKIDGIPLGWYKEGKVTVYSGDYGRSNFKNLSVYDDQISAAESEMARVRNEVLENLTGISKAYVYVGSAALRGSVELIVLLQKAGIEVVMLACDCQQDAKIEVASAYRLEIIWSDCGGRRSCARLVRELA